MAVAGRQSPDMFFYRFLTIALFPDLVVAIGFVAVARRSSALAVVRACSKSFHGSRSGTRMDAVQRSLT